MTDNSIPNEMPNTIGVRLAVRLVEASTRRVRNRFTRGEIVQALGSVLDQGVSLALGTLNLGDEQRGETLQSIFETYFLRDEVVAELAQVIDPRPDLKLDLDLLKEEFNALPFDRNALQIAPTFDFEKMIRSFLGGLYGAAAASPQLKEAIPIDLLHNLAERMGALAEEVQPVPQAVEQKAGGQDTHFQEVIERRIGGQGTPDELTNAVRDVTQHGFTDVYLALQTINETLLKSGHDIKINEAGNVFIGDGTQVDSKFERSVLYELQAEITKLRQAIEGHQPDENELAMLETRYRQHIVRWFDRLTFQGMMRSAQAISLPLEDVYVELRSVAEVPEAADTFSVEERRLLLGLEDSDESIRTERLRELDTLRKERWSRSRLERKSITEALYTQNQRAFVILGDPGSGKTTLLHLLALVYARGPESAAARLNMPIQDAARLPIFAPLAAYDDMRQVQRGLTLFDFLGAYFDQRRGLPGLMPLFKQALEDGRAIILLDGLDEVLETSTRQYVAEQVRALIENWAGRGNRIVLTSRFVGYREAPVGGNIPHLSVLDFGVAEIKTFVHRWARAYETWAAGGQETLEVLQEAQKVEKALNKDVESNPSVRRLAANPLMLTMLALLRRQVGPLPNRRIELYKLYIETMINNWISARSAGAREKSPEQLNTLYVESMLIALAYWLQSEKPSGTASREDMQTVLTRIDLEYREGSPENASRQKLNEAEDRAHHFLGEMRQMTGLIVERGHDAFGFLHLTFQEYFAGRALAKMQAEERWSAIQKHLHDPRWREPIMLCAGRLGVIESRRQDVSQFVRMILQNPDQTEQDLHRNLLLALSISGDDVNLEPALLKEIIERAAAALHTKVYALAGELARRLGQVIANERADPARWLEPALKSPDPILRRILVEALGNFCSHEEVRTTILTCLADEDNSVKKAAIEALAPLVEEDPRLVEAILAKIADGSIEVKGAVIDALAPLLDRHPKILSRFLDRLWDASPVVIQKLCKAITPVAFSNEQVRKTLLESSGGWYGDMSAYQGVVIELATRDPRARERVFGYLDPGNYYFTRNMAKALIPLVESDPTVRESLLKFIEGNGFAPGRAQAMSALTTLVSQDSEIRARLLTIVKNKNENESVRQEAVRTLAPTLTIDNQVLEAIRAALNDPIVVRSAAVEALASLAGKDPLTRNDILKKLHDRSSEVRQKAVEALTPLVASNEEVRKAVLECLTDSSAVVQKTAVRALAALVILDREVREKFEGLFDDPDWEVRLAVGQSVGEALAKIENPRILLELLDAAGNSLKIAESAPFNEDFLRAVAPIVAKHEQVRATVLGRLKQKQNKAGIRKAAVETLAGALPTDPLLRATMMKLLREETAASVRQAALIALIAAIHEDVAIRNAIIKSLDDPNVDIQLAVVRALAPQVAEDETIRQAFLERLERLDQYSRQAALRALLPLFNSDKPTQAKITSLIKIRDAGVKEDVVRSLEPLVESNAEIRALLVERLRLERSIDLRATIVRALTPAAQADAAVAEALIGLLQEKNPRLRDYVISALGPLAGEDARVRTALMNQLVGTDRELLWSSLNSLARLLEADKEVRAAFTAVLQDREPSIRLWTYNALIPYFDKDETVRKAIEVFQQSKYYAEIKEAGWEEYPGIEVPSSIGPMTYSRYPYLYYPALDIPSGNNYMDSDMDTLSRLVETDESIRNTLQYYLRDSYSYEDNRVKAVRALAPLAQEEQDEPLTSLMRCLEDSNAAVRLAASESLGMQIGRLPRLRETALTWLTDANWRRRQSAVSTILSSDQADAILGDRWAELVVWLQMDGRRTAENRELANTIRSHLAKLIGAQLPESAALREQLLDWLDHPRWSTRLGALMSLANWPGSPPEEVVKKLIAALDDNRGLESFPARLDAVSYLINRNEYSAHAIWVCMEALAYGTQPWEDLPESLNVRKQAALILGKLEPLYFDASVYASLRSVMFEDVESEVRDSAYGALERLARLM